MKSLRITASKHLDLVLCNAPTRWWCTHKDSFDERWDYKRMMRLWFGNPNTMLTEKYSEKDDLCDNLVRWTKAWGIEPHPQWVHIFFHTFDTIPMNWYLEMELRHDTAEWDILREGFLLTFSFEDNFVSINEALQEIKVVIFKMSQEHMEWVQPY